MNKFQSSKNGVVAVNAAIAAWKDVRHLATAAMAERIAKAIAAWDSRDWDAVRSATKNYSALRSRWRSYTPSIGYEWCNGAALRAYELLRNIARHTPAVIGQDSHRRGVVPYIAYAASHADALRKASAWTDTHPRCTTSYRAAGNLS